MKIFQKPLTFEWDVGNRDKNWRKHRVTNTECEEIFFDSHKKILRDTLHSGQEKRYVLFGQTKQKRLLIVIFTIRGQRLRVISGRDMNKKERKLYEEKT